MSEFVSAFSKTTGVKHSIPRKWLGHPVLGKDFELTPSQRAADDNGAGDDAGAGFPAGGEPPQSDKPGPDAMFDELLEYAAEHDVDVDTADDEAQLRAAIDQHNESR